MTAEQRTVIEAAEALVAHTGTILQLRTAVERMVDARNLSASRREAALIAARVFSERAAEVTR